MARFFYSITLLVLLAGCNPDLVDPNPGNQPTYVPVYRMPENIYVTKFSAAQPIQKAGKQYVFGPMLLQNEEQKGIHLIDVSNPAAPNKLGFLDIPLCTDMAVSQGFLYANNYADLVVYDLRGTGEPQLVQRIKDVFPPANQDYPPLFNVAFECPDKSKGVVVGWELKNDITARCRR